MDRPCAIIASRNFEQMFRGREGKHMNSEELKKYIIEMVQKIDDTESLKRIFNYVHKFFIRKTGK